MRHGKCRGVEVQLRRFTVRSVWIAHRGWLVEDREELARDVDLRGGYAQTQREAPYEYSFTYVRTNNPNDPLGVQYAPAHPVELAPGGWLERIAGAREVMVNSLHGQGIRDLAPGLVVEATAPDGLIEAVRLDRGNPDVPDPFLLAVQWHPEWRVTENPFYLGIFQAFAAACRHRSQKRH